LITPDGGQRLQQLNNVIARLQQNTTRNQEDLRRLRDLTIPQIQQRIAQLQEGMVSLPELQNRIEALEIQSNATSSSSGDIRNTGRVMREIRRLTVRVNVLKARLEADECENNPCQHGGTCIDGYLQYKCL
ncbi:hypothetical protein OTU49_004489, partial [Cherax quadricarinatus]